MVHYADKPARRTRQVVADVFVVCFIAGAIWLAVGIHDGIAAWGEWGVKVESSGRNLSNSLTNVGATFASVPLVGDAMRAPFDTAANAANELEAAGKDIQAQVANFARIVAWVAALVPIFFILLIWLPLRLRFAIRAGTIRALSQSPEGMELLALRALAREPLGHLRAIGPDVASKWRKGDPEAVRALAELSLGHAGMRVPRARTKTAPLE